MFIHIGGDISLSDKWIIAVLDLDAVTHEHSETRNFLMQSEARGSLEWIGHELPRSLVVALDRNYLSPVRAETIRKRYQLAQTRNKE